MHVCATVFFLYAGAVFAEIEATGKLLLKIPTGKNQIFVLVFPDETVNGYKIEPVVVREQTWNEFFRGINPQVPQQFLVAKEDWLLGNEIEVYPKEDVVGVDFTYCVNQTVLLECTHVLVNKANDAMFFAKTGDSKRLEDFFDASMKQMQEDAYQEGYTKAKEEVESTPQMVEQPVRDFNEDFVQEGVPVVMESKALDQETASDDVPMVTLPIALPEEPVQAVEPTPVALPEEPVQAVEPTPVALPEEPVQDLDPSMIALPEESVEAVDPSMIALPEEPVQALDSSEGFSMGQPHQGLLKNDPEALLDSVEEDEAVLALALELVKPTVAVVGAQAAQEEKSQEVSAARSENSAAIFEGEASEESSSETGSVTGSEDEDEDKKELALLLL